MSRLTVEVDVDHLRSLIRKPLRGLAELVWNAIDADASSIDIEVTHTDSDAVDQIIVVDDGIGIDSHRANEAFGRLGGSWKKSAIKSDAGRTFHGQKGQGRWAAYALGTHIQWSSVAKGVEHTREGIFITGNSSSLREFAVEGPTPRDAATATGTVVTISNVTTAAQNLIDKDTVAHELAAEFAAHLMQYPIKLTWRNERVDPVALQQHVESVMVPVEGLAEPLPMTVIEWTTNVPRALHLCTSDGVSLGAIPPGIQAPGIGSFTAYLCWDQFSTIPAVENYVEMDGHETSHAVEAAKEELRRYFRKRANQRSAELVAAWKADDTYPYKSEPTDILEQAERDFFDIVAVTASPAISNSDTKARKLSLRLLRQALEKGPQQVKDILHDVLELSPERLDDLHQLLARSSLDAIIAAGTEITNRLDFIEGLREIVFDTELRHHVLERSQLHRILAGETWVFRDEYALTADDVALRTALRQHVTELGRPDLNSTDIEAAEVLDENGRRVVVDLMLSRVVEQSENRRHHIIIELKRPDKTIGHQEHSQIINYATALSEDARFAQIDTTWEFWIVGDRLASSVVKQANQDNREPGITLKSDGLTVRAVTWSKILEDATHRLKFVKQALEYESSQSAGMQYLRKFHSKFLPNEAATHLVPEESDIAVSV